MKSINMDYKYSPNSITTNWSIPAYVWNTIDVGLAECEKTIEKNKTKGKEKHMKINMPKIKNIDFQPPLTVVIWEDGTKTFVKCDNNEVFDPEKGAAMAIAKKALGDKYNYIETISYYVDKWLKKDCHKKCKKLVFSDDENEIINNIRECDSDITEATKFILDVTKEMKAEYNNRKYIIKK